MKGAVSSWKGIRMEKQAGEGREKEAGFGNTRSQGKYKESLLAKHKRSDRSGSCVNVDRSPGPRQTHWAQPGTPRAWALVNHVCRDAFQFAISRLLLFSLPYLPTDPPAPFAEHLNL